MPDLIVKFIHPMDGRILTATIDAKLTAKEAISELVNAKFIPDNSGGYGLSKKGGAMIANNSIFEELAIKDNDIFIIIPATDAG